MEGGRRGADGMPNGGVPYPRYLAVPERRNWIPFLLGHWSNPGLLSDSVSRCGRDGEAQRCSKQAQRYLLWGSPALRYDGDSNRRRGISGWIRHGRAHADARRALLFRLLAMTCLPRRGLP